MLTAVPDWMLLQAFGWNLSGLAVEQITMSELVRHDGEVSPPQSRSQPDVRNWNRAHTVK